MQSHLQPRNDDISFAKQTVKDLTTQRLNVLTSKSTHPLTPAPHIGRGKKVAFTLAAVLITLGIIGVVAAMTLPTVIEKHQKQVTVNRLKKAYSTLSQMVIRTYADNGSVSDYLGSGTVVDANTTKEFFATYRLPYFNAPIVANHYFYNNNSTPFKSFKGKPMDIGIYTAYGAGRILFSTQDGTIYHVQVMDWVLDENGNNTGVAVYNKHQEVFVDVNGEKEPNIEGKDIFRFVVDFNNNVVQPWCDSRFSISDINNGCDKTKGAGYCCSAKIIKDGWQIKDDYPW